MWRAAAVFAFFAVTAAHAQDDSGAIQGTVTDAATGWPVLAAQVTLTPAGTAPDAVTDTNGGFRFEKLAPGRYGVRVVRDGYRESFRFIDLKGGASAEKINLLITPLSDVAGHVLDEEGHPLAGVLVGSGARPGATTDAEGAYRIAGLAPGDYQFRYRVPQELREQTLLRGEKTGETFGYWDASTEINLAAGVHLEGLDVRLRRIRLVSVKGRVTDTAGEALRNAAVELENEDKSAVFDRRRVDGDGKFRFELVPPGRYSMLVFREGLINVKCLPYRVALELGPAGVDDAEWRIPEYVTLAVNVKTPHPEVPVEGWIVVTPDAQHSFNSSDGCKVGEACAVRGVPPGTTSFRVQGEIRQLGDSPGPLYVASVRLGQQNAWGVPVTVVEGTNPPIEITLTNKIGSIWANVVTDDGQPAESAALVATPPEHEGTMTNRLFRNYGPFRLEAMPVGEYRVAAFVKRDDEQQGLRTGLPARCGDRVVTVEVEEGQTASVTLRPCVATPQGTPR